MNNFLLSYLKFVISTYYLFLLWIKVLSGDGSSPEFDPDRIRWFFSLGSSPLFSRPGIKICFMLNPDPNLFRIFWLAALILFLYCGGAGQRVLPGRLGHHYLPQVGGAYNPEVLWPLIGIWLCQASLLLAIRGGLVKHGVYRLYGRCMHGVHCFTRDIYYENFAKEQRRKLHQKRSKMP